MWGRDEMHVGWYVCAGRCPPVCWWDGDRFQCMVFTMGAWTVQEQLHWDDDPKYGTVKPLEPLEEVFERANLFKLM